MPPSCTRCDLHATCQTVHIPSRWWRKPAGSPNATQLLIIIGKAPGHEEDKEGQCFIGPSGQILNDWLSAMQFSDDIDIWLSNTVRCRLVSDDNPLTQHQIHRCRKHLAEELRQFSEQYERITLLVLGADASQAFDKGAIRKAIKSNGAPQKIIEKLTCYAPKKIQRRIKWGEDRVVRVQGFKKTQVTKVVGEYPLFVTYHPAATLPDRSPEKIHAVADHLQMLDSHLNREPLVDVVINKGVDPVPPYMPKLDALSLDIETYGILERFKQTVFNPRKSLEIDKVSTWDLIQCVGIAWEDGDEVRSASFLWNDYNHRTILLRWLTQLRQDGGSLIFMNSLFDLAYLRVFPDMRQLLDFGLRVEDLIIWNQLDSDQRAERDLKSLQRLYRLKSGDAHSFVQYPRADDPELHHYVKEDAATTLWLRNKMLKTVDPAGQTEYAKGWFSNLIWSTLHMVESGATMDPAKFWELKIKNDAELDALRRNFKAVTDMPLAGPGSGKSIPKVIEAAYRSIHEAPPLTDKGNIKTDKLVIQNLRLDLPDGPHLDIIERVARHRELAQMNDHYCTKRLNSLLKGGRVCPGWYLAPSQFSDNEDSVYGTKQGRISCSNPGLQTDPSEIVACWTSRFDDGVLVRMDLKQIELVVSGLMSSDIVMLEGMDGDGDLHTARAIDFWGPSVVEKPDFKTWRHTAKTTNFLIIYRGNATVLQQTLLKRQGLRVAKGECQRIINKTRRIYSGLWAWQDRLIYEATQNGYMTDPILGYRRWLTTNRNINRGVLESTICNFPIQRIAACTTLDLQNYVVMKIESLGLQSRLTFNGFDALVVDCPRHEVETVKQILSDSLTHSEYWRNIESMTRPWKLKAEFEFNPQLMEKQDGDTEN